MSSFVGGSRVSIPGNVRKTIHDIREITGKQHSDDEIYAVLRECSMDPNETIQKLLYLDTFHEVKRKRDRKKENFNAKAAEERPGVGMQRRGSRGAGQGNYGSNFSSDAGGGKNSARRENGGPPFSHRGRNNAASRAARTPSALPNGSAALSNGYASKPAVDSELQSLTDVSKSGLTSNETVDGVNSSPALDLIDTEEDKSLTNSEQTSTPVSLPKSDVNSSLDSLSPPSDFSMVENEVGSLQSVGEPNQFKENNIPLDDNVGLGKAESDGTENEDVNLGQEEKNATKPRALESSKPLSVSSSEEVADIAAEVKVLSLSESNASNGQHVTFPVHFQVSEALKTGLTFGSFDIAFGPKGESVNVVIENGDAADTCEDGDVVSIDIAPSSQNVTAAVEDGYLDNSQSLSRAIAKLQPSEGQVTSTDCDQKGEQPKAETQFLPEGPQGQSVITMPNYNLGVIPTIVGNISYEGVEAQTHEARVPIFANGNSFVPPATNPSPPLPSSIAMSPQTVPVFRQTYPPNFYPYGQYISPFYMSPMHQYLGHNGFAPQPTPGGVYLPPAAAAAGVKFTLPQFKPGNNVGNPPPHIGIQPAGSFLTAPVGYAQPVTSGSSLSNDELMVSHMKENQIYTTGQLTEGSGIWVHTPGQDMPALPMNSMYNVPHQAHIAFPPQQTAHAGAFAGMFPPGHAMTAPSTLLQQSQAVAGPIEAIGPPSGAPYQQPHQAQINWNTAF